MKMSELVKAVKDHATLNYHKDGWDYVVECYEDEEIADEIRGAREPREAIQMIGKILKAKDDQRKDIQSEVF
jgi:hypothetical protein